MQVHCINCNELLDADLALYATDDLYADVPMCYQCAPPRWDKGIYLHDELIWDEIDDEDEDDE